MHIFCLNCVLRVNTGREYEQDGKKEMIFTLKPEFLHLHESNFQCVQNTHLVQFKVCLAILSTLAELSVRYKFLFGLFLNIGSFIH